MAVRFYPDGSFEYIDPIGVGTTAGGGPVYDDGVQSPPWVPPPFANRNEIMASRAMELMALPAEMIAQQRPPVPQQLFPPRFGYVGEPLTIDDIFQDNAWTPRIRSWISGPPRTLVRTDEGSEYQGSVRPAISDGSGSTPAR